MIDKLQPGWAEAFGKLQPSLKTAKPPRDGRPDGSNQPIVRRSGTKEGHKESCSRGGKKGGPKRHQAKLLAPPELPPEEDC